MLTLQYLSGGQMLYGSVSSGFKSGSYSITSVTNPGPVDPEEITSYEIGGKHDLNWRYAHFDWSLFYYTYKDLQVNARDPTTGAVNTAQNAAKLEGKGLDFNFYLPIVDNLEVKIGGELLDVKYDSFPDAAVINIDPVTNMLIAPPNDVILEDVSGNRSPRAPEVTISSQLIWTLPTTWGEFLSTATWYYNDGFYLDPGNRIHQEAYDMVNLNVRFSPENARWNLSVWGRNLTDEDVIGGIFNSPYGVYANYGEPRLVGATFEYKF